MFWKKSLFDKNLAIKDNFLSIKCIFCDEYKICEEQTHIRPLDCFENWLVETNEKDLAII